MHGSSTASPGQRRAGPRADLPLSRPGHRRDPRGAAGGHRAVPRMGRGGSSTWPPTPTGAPRLRGHARLPGRGPGAAPGRPRDDVISDLAAAELDGERLGDEEIFSFLRLLLPAGAETTYRATGNLLFGLLTNPDQLAALATTVSLMTQAVEEAIRWESPLLITSRQPTRDSEVAGTVIPAGTQVVAHVGSANHDEPRWDRPGGLRPLPGAEAPRRLRLRPPHVPRDAPGPDGDAGGGRRRPRPPPRPPPRPRRRRRAHPRRAVPLAHLAARPLRVDRSVQIEIVPERCMGSGNCAFWAPATFDIGDDNVAFVVDPEGDPEDKIRNAAEGCPTQAIVLVVTLGVSEDHRALHETARRWVEARGVLARGPGGARRPDRRPPAVLGRAGRAGLARPARARGARRLRATGWPSWPSCSRSWAGPVPPARSCRPCSPRPCVDRLGGARPRAALLPGPGRRLDARGGGVRLRRRRPPSGRPSSVRRRRGDRRGPDRRDGWARLDADAVEVDEHQSLDPTRRLARCASTGEPDGTASAAEPGRAASATWPRRCWPPSRPAGRPGASTPRPPTPRTASSSAVRSGSSRRSSTAAPTCSAPSSRPGPRPGTPPAGGDDDEVAPGRRGRRGPRARRLRHASPRTASRSTAASASPGSTTPTSTSSGPSPSASSSAARRRWRDLVVERARAGPGRS